MKPYPTSASVHNWWKLQFFSRPNQIIQYFCDSVKQFISRKHAHPPSATWRGQEWSATLVASQRKVLHLALRCLCCHIIRNWNIRSCCVCRAQLSNLKRPRVECHFSRDSAKGTASRTSLPVLPRSRCFRKSNFAPFRQKYDSSHDTVYSEDHLNSYKVFHWESSVPHVDNWSISCTGNDGDTLRILRSGQGKWGDWPGGHILGHISS
jgi:hypothetical protein